MWSTRAWQILSRCWPADEMGVKETEEPKNPWKNNSVSEVRAKRIEAAAYGEGVRASSDNAEYGDGDLRTGERLAVHWKKRARDAPRRLH